MRQHLLHQQPLLAFPSSTKADQSPAALEAVTCHLQLVHRVDVLDVKLCRRAVGRLGRPKVEVLVSSGFEVEGVVARVKVRELVDQVEGRLGVELGICGRERREFSGQARDERRDRSSEWTEGTHPF